jgi:hypothetical protein
MPTDAKCGLLVGVGLVLAVAVLFFQKDPPSEPAVAPAAVKAQAPSPAAALKPPEPPPERPIESSPLAPGRPVSRGEEASETLALQAIERPCPPPPISSPS